MKLVLTYYHESGIETLPFEYSSAADANLQLQNALETYTYSCIASEQHTQMRLKFLEIVLDYSSDKSLAARNASRKEVFEKIPIKALPEPIFELGGLTLDLRDIKDFQIQTLDEWFDNFNKQ